MSVKTTFDTVIQCAVLTYELLKSTNLARVKKNPKTTPQKIPLCQPCFILHTTKVEPGWVFPFLGYSFEKRKKPFAGS